jgi:uncharacterized membrane protein (UPF0127 family)
MRIERNGRHTGRSLRVLAMLAAWLICLATDLAAESNTIDFARVLVHFIPVHGSPRDLKLELATTEEQRQRGLMFRERLSDQEGMVFLYDPPQPAAMWMKNTLVPLDMLFVDAQGRVVYIAARTEPLSLKPVSAGTEVRMVIELAGGNSDRLGVRVGDRVEFDKAATTSGSSTPH